MRRLLPALGLLVALGPTVSARAQTEQDISVVQGAQSLYEGGSFLEAGRAFEVAYERTEHPSMLYNAYVAYRDGSLPRDALRVLTTYLEVVSPDDPDRERLALRRDALVRSVAELDAEPEIAPEPEPEPEAGPGPPTEAATRTPEAAPPDEGGGGPSLAGPGVLLGVGGAALVAGFVVAGLTAADHASFEERCAAGCPELADEAETGRTQALVADILVAAGGAVAIAGLIWLIVELSGGDGDEVVAEGAARWRF